MTCVNFVSSGLYLAQFVKVFISVGDTWEPSQEARAFEYSSMEVWILFKSWLIWRPYNLQEYNHSGSQLLIYKMGLRTHLANRLWVRCPHAQWMPNKALHADSMLESLPTVLSAKRAATGSGIAPFSLALQLPKSLLQPSQLSLFCQSWLLVICVVGYLFSNIVTE